MSFQPQLGSPQLTYFVRVAEAGQITRAAQLLHVAQPALSRSMARLEERLGVRLFERHPRGVALTPAGTIFYERASEALRAQEALAAAAASLARAAADSLTVGFLGPAPDRLAVAAVERFSRAHPASEVAFRELGFPGGEMQEWMGGTDVALLFMEGKRAGAGVQAIREEPRWLLLHGRHRLATAEALLVADVLDEEFCGCHPSVDPLWAGFWTMDDHRGGPPRRRTADEPVTYLELIAAVHAGHGVWALPAGVAEAAAALSPGLIARPLLDAAPATLAVACRGDRESPLAAAFVEAALAGADAGGRLVPPDLPAAA